MQKYIFTFTSFDASCVSMRCDQKLAMQCAAMRIAMRHASCCDVLRGLRCDESCDGSGDESCEVALDENCEVSCVKLA
jgi:hypothetical protein